MVKNEVKLKGSLHGSKKLVPYKNPDIIRSSVDNNICLINDLRVKYLEDKKRFYIYNSYSGLDKEEKRNYTGRWYMGNYEYNSKDLNSVDNTFSIELKSIDWEDFETGKSDIKNVKIKIELTPNGFEKLKKMLMIQNIKIIYILNYAGHTKIPKDIIENFEKDYKENVIQPTTEVNCDGHIVSYIRSLSGNREDLKNKKRVYKRTADNGYDYYSPKYSAVYFEIPNNKQIMYSYIFYDEEGWKEIFTSAKVNDANCANGHDYIFNVGGGGCYVD